jgi:ATP-dependent DNA helicase RecG
MIAFFNARSTTMLSSGVPGTQSNRESFMQCRRMSQSLFGDDYATLTPIEVQTLVTAALEGEVSNGRLQLFRSEHPVELTRMLQNLTSRGFLDQLGQKRGSCYRLPNWASPVKSEATALAPGATALAPGASALAPGASALAPEQDRRLLAIAKPARDKKKLIPSLTRTIIRNLCQGHFPTADQVGALMDRGKDKLQKNFLADMVQHQELELRYPEQPTHPDQAYRTNPEWSET